MYERQTAILEVAGKPAVNSFGVVAPSMFGKTTLQLFNTRIVEKTRRIVATRHCEVLLSEVDSVEITEDGNPWWLVLGFFTLGLYGLGIIFFILYFLFKYKYLIIRSGSNVQVIVISGSQGMEKSRLFMAEVLKTSEHLKRFSKD